MTHGRAEHNRFHSSLRSGKSLWEGPSVVVTQSRVQCSGERERAEVVTGKGSTRLSLPWRVVRDGWLVTTPLLHHTEKHTPSHRLQGDRYLGLFYFLQSTDRESSIYWLHLKNISDDSFFVITV